MIDPLLLGAFFFVAAVLYASVGHAGASAYLAIMGLTGVAPDVARPTALALNIILTAFQSFRTNWAEALGGPGLVGVLIGWAILIVILFYARGLAKKGVLVY